MHSYDLYVILLHEFDGLLVTDQSQMKLHATNKLLVYNCPNRAVPTRHAFLIRFFSLPVVINKLNLLGSSVMSITVVDHNIKAIILRSHVDD